MPSLQDHSQAEHDVASVAKQRQLAHELVAVLAGHAGVAGVAGIAGLAGTAEVVETAGFAMLAGRMMLVVLVAVAANKYGTAGCNCWRIGRWIG